MPQKCFAWDYTFIVKRQVFTEHQQCVPSGTQLKRCDQHANLGFIAMIITKPVTETFKKDAVVFIPVSALENGALI